MQIGDNARVALILAKNRVPVFPCTPSGARAKQPLTRNGHHDATVNADQIRTWWIRRSDALVGVPTGAKSGVWVFDVDDEIGLQSMRRIIARLRLDRPSDLTRCISRTPGGGLHLIFRLLPGERPRNRARDIGAGLDTRGVKPDGTSAGYFIAPGSTLLDGRRYQPVDGFTLEPSGDIASFASALPAPRELLYFATFSAVERAVIKAHSVLCDAFRNSDAGHWPGILRSFQATQRAALAKQLVRAPTDANGMRAQALYDLHEASRSYATLQDDRRNSLFKHAARLARYVAHRILTAAELRSALFEAATANGALRSYGGQWAEGCISRAIELGKNDPLPPLARRFRTEA